MRQYFEEYPEGLRQLARYSLESGTLLTPAVVPLTSENYRGFNAAVERWIELRDRRQKGRVRESDVDVCLAIHQTLLDCSEEASYPTAMHLLHLLQAAKERPVQPWQETWQDYLQSQLKSGKYIDYQEMILLWVLLFPDQDAQNKLARLIVADYNADGTAVQSYAQRFIASVSNDPPDKCDLRDLRGLRYLRYLQYLRDLHYLRELRSLEDLRYMVFLRYLEDTDLDDLRDLRYLWDLRPTFRSLIDRFRGSW